MSALRYVVSPTGRWHLCDWRGVGLSLCGRRVDDWQLVDEGAAGDVCRNCRRSANEPST